MGKHLNHSRLWDYIAHGNMKRVEASSLNKHKVPPSYSRADDCARSLNGRQDDEKWCAGAGLGLFRAEGTEARRGTFAEGEENEARDLPAPLSGSYCACKNRVPLFS